MKKDIKLAKYFFPVIFALIGAVGGYLYYRLVGCVTGTCAISSDPYISTIYGAVMGILLGIVLSPGNRVRKSKEDSEQ